MVFGTRHTCSKIHFEQIAFEGNTIARATKVKYLGIQLDPLLNFADHVEYIKRKTISKVKLLGSLNQILSKDTLLMLYKTLILPIIDYGDIIFDGINQKDAVVLQKVQNMAFKSILQVPKWTSTATTHAELDMLTLSQRRFLHTAKQMFKVDRGLCPPQILVKFQRRSDISNVHTRSSTMGNFEIPNYRLHQSRRNFVYRGMLPLDLRSIEDIDTFVSSTKQWLIDGDVGLT